MISLRQVPPRVTPVARSTPTPDGPLVQVGLAGGHAGRQAQHGHGGHPQEDDDADIRHPQVADVLEARVQIHPVFDQGLVGGAAQAIEAAEGVEDVMIDLCLRHQDAPGGAIVGAHPAGDHQDAVAAGAVGRFDDEILVFLQLRRQPADLELLLHHQVELRHRDARLDRDLLGAQFIIHQGIVTPGIMAQGKVGVAPVNPHDAQCRQSTSRAPHYCNSLSKVRKRQSSTRR